MRYKLTIPARINVLGNPSDANEGDFATISAAVDVRAGAVVEPAHGLILEALRRLFRRSFFQQGARFRLPISSLDLSTNQKGCEK